MSSSNQIIHLEIGSSNLFDKTADLLFTSLKSNAYLVSLSIVNTNEFWNKLSNKAWNSLSDMLSVNWILTSLNLTNNGLKNEGLALIAKGMTTHS